MKPKKPVENTVKVDQFNMNDTELANTGNLAAHTRAFLGRATVSGDEVKTMTLCIEWLEGIHAKIQQQLAAFAPPAQKTK